MGSYWVGEGEVSSSSLSNRPGCPGLQNVLWFTEEINIDFATRRIHTDSSNDDDLRHTHQVDGGENQRRCAAEALARPGDATFHSWGSNVRVNEHNNESTITRHASPTTDVLESVLSYDPKCQEVKAVF